MSGKRINNKQVGIYMSARNEGYPQATASAKAGLSERTGRRIENGEVGTLGKEKIRSWRTRQDPFAEVWEKEVEPKLKKQPRLSPTTLFEALQESHPDAYPDAMKRTFQRRVKQWKAMHGPDKEVMFRQQRVVGRLGLSDFTELKQGAISMGGQPLIHRLYHFRMAFSGWRYVRVVLGGESFTALAEGLQEALWRLGGAPQEHRTDSLSAAYKNLSRAEQEDLTERYRALCIHYGMRPTRNNRGQGHENGAIESPHGHLKRRIEQGLLLRGNNDFESAKAYQHWLEEIIKPLNRQCRELIQEERRHLHPLPLRRTTDYTEQVVLVTTSSTIEVKRALYTVPARLKGESLRLHIYDDRIKAYVGSQLAVTLTRVYPRESNRRARCIDYRHVISGLVRKPQAFRYSQIRDDLLPNDTYRQIWLQLDQQLEPRAACKRIVGILALAAEADCEDTLGDYMLQQLAAHRVPPMHELEQRFARPTHQATHQVWPPAQGLPASQVVRQHPLSAYDALLSCSSQEVD